MEYVLTAFLGAAAAFTAVLSVEVLVILFNEARRKQFMFKVHSLGVKGTIWHELGR